MSWAVVSNWFFLICCAYALVAFGVRWLLRGATPQFDATAELLGHPMHSLSMIYMLLVMLGLAPIFIASTLWIGCFLLCATFFGLRLLLDRASVGRHDAFDILFALAMAYMWTDPSGWPPLLTAAICLVCLLRIGASLRRSKVREVLKHPSQPNMPALLATSSHIALLSAMLALFIIMQPGHLLPAPELAGTNAAPAPCVETMPGMKMCP
jgi:hypothetical protein